MVEVPGRVAALGGASAVLAALLVAVPGVAQAAGSTYWVAASGCSDAGPGTQAQPFCTLQRAAAVATTPGSTVLVGPGSYAGGVVVGGSGAPGSPITFSAAPGAQVTVVGGTNGFAITGRHDVVVNGFAVTGTTSYGIAVRTSTAVTVSGNTVTFSGRPVKGQIAAGIYLSGVTASTVSRNVADRNSDSGIYLSGGSTGVVVSGNEASFNANGYQRNANGINVISPGNTIIRNVLHDNEDSGIQFYPGGNDNLATLNVAYNNGDHGIDDLNVTGGRIIGNTIVRNCTTGINVEGTSGNFTVMNNIAVDNAVYPAYNGISCNRRKGNIGIWDSAPPTTVVDHNLVQLTTSGTLYVFGTSYTSLAAMQAATGQEENGLQGDPRFVSTAGWDLRLQATSPAVDHGTSAAPGEQSTDILGNPRVDVPGVPNSSDGGSRPYDDLGAYEYQPATQPQPPTAALTVSPSSGAAPLPVTADASGSGDPQGQALSYRFDFGDGSVTGPQPGATASHTYAAAGTYTVTLTVTDTDGLTATATRTVTVSTAAPQPPTAALTVSPSSGAAPLPVTADASGSGDPQGQALSYRFDFGDGSVTGPQPGATASHTYAAAGTYTVTLTVTDTDGLTATATRTVTVTATTAPPAYVSQIASNYSLNVHTSGSITVYKAAGVAAGDTAVLTVHLTGTAPTGAVGGTDTRGNSYTVAADSADAFGNRLLVLTGTVTTALLPNDKITVTFPSASTYRILGDEVARVTAVDRTATGAGTGTSFASAPTAVTSVPSEVVFAAVAMDGGTAPTWAAGWTPLTSYAVNTTWMGRAYRQPTATGSFTAAGTGAGHWVAAVVTLR